MTFRKNQTVEYIGNIVPLLHGKRGKVDSVVRRGGWIDVDFGDGHGIVRCGTISLRAVGKSAVEPDHRDDTVDALVQAEAFIAGFEGDPLQEGVPDMLAGLRAAITREQAAKPDLIGVLTDAETCLANTLTARGYKPGSNTDGWSAEVRLEVRTLAVLRATIAQMEGC